MIEYPKWIYLTDEPQALYADGFAPMLVQSREQEDALSEDVSAELDSPVAKRGRPRKAE